MRCPLQINVRVNVYLLRLGYRIEDAGFVSGKSEKIFVSKMFQTSLEPT